MKACVLAEVLEVKVAILRKFIDDDILIQAQK